MKRMECVVILLILREVLLAGDLGGNALVSLLRNGEPHSAPARERDVRLRALADYEHVVQPADEHTRHYNVNNFLPSFTI